MMMIVDENGELIETIKEGDRVKITTKEELDRLREERNKVEINEGMNFIKLYTNTLEDLISENLTSAEFKVLLVCLKNLRYETGAVAFENNGEFLI